MDYLNLPNGRFAYVRQGRGSPVLLLHGLGSSLLDWQPQIEHLAQHCEVFALDVRGHGQSEPLRAPVSMAEFSQPSGTPRPSISSGSLPLSSRLSCSTAERIASVVRALVASR